MERRTGNNVPVCYETEEAYQSAVLLDGYNDLLQTTVEVEPILAFLEEHLAGASAEVQDTMLRGLTGFLDGNEAGLDWERIAACYAWRDRRCPKNSNKKAEEHETEIPETDIGAAPAGRTGRPAARTGRALRAARWREW